MFAVSLLVVVEWKHVNLLAGDEEEENEDKKESYLGLVAISCWVIPAHRFQICAIMTNVSLEGLKSCIEFQYGTHDSLDWGGLNK